MAAFHRSFTSRSHPHRHSRESGNPGASDPMKQPCVYILASQRNGTLYVGVTSDIVRRVWKHKVGMLEGFTKQYGVHRLVYAEFHETMADAISREKRIKEWRRAWMLELIERGNPTWKDLYDEFVGSPGSPLSRG
jgi:putative endonuclease